jgi:N-acetylmuramoyl-L-alanine amidase
MSDQPVALFQLGDRGAAVRSIRALLHATGDLAPSTVEASDVYDEEVAQAVRAFQQRRGLLVDGVLGPHTHIALDGAHWKLGDRMLSHIPGHMLQGDDVAELQERLLSLGFTPDRVDGVFGTHTEHAVRRFQANVGLAVDGRVGPQTLRAFADLNRSVSGGSPYTLREEELVRSSGHRLLGRIVVLDPGHGGDDTGTVAHGLTESEVTLDLARRIEGRLSAIGVTVLFTRSATTGPDDLLRATMANQAHADIMLSLHCDSTDQSRASGVATFFWGLQRFGAWSAVGEHLANLIQREIVSRTDLADCRSHPRGWQLLQRTQMPTVRIEAGYLSHPQDAAHLGDPAFLDTLAEAIVIALQRMYLGEDDTNATGVLRLGDLGAYNAKQRAATN